MSLPNIFVICVDRLGSGWLGPYGNSWVETPALNDLAAQSLLCEFVLSNSHELAAVYRSYFTGHAAGPTLAEIAQSSGYQTLLVADADDFAPPELLQGFVSQAIIAKPPPTRLARSLEATRLADVFSAAAEHLTATDQPQFHWLHVGSLDRVWDAPYPLRERLTGEDDPPPPKFVVPPSLELKVGHDPDELLGIVQSYAAQVMALDECLGSFLEIVDQTLDPANTLIAVTSPRGFALGEHLRVGIAGDSLRGEVLQVPLLIRYPNREQRLTRLMSLQQPVDLFAVLARCMHPEVASLSEHGFPENRSLAVASTPQELALRTKHWFYRQSGSGDERQHELYAKPDDRWEVNQVSGRASETVAAFDELAQQVRELSGTVNLESLELPELLVAGRR